MRDINEIRAVNAARSAQPSDPVTIPSATLDAALHALRVARSSLQDVLNHGCPGRQRATITNVDLPTIERALASVERAQAAPTSPKPRIFTAENFERTLAAQKAEKAGEVLGTILDGEITVDGETTRMRPGTHVIRYPGGEIVADERAAVAPWRPGLTELTLPCRYAEKDTIEFRAGYCRSAALVQVTVFEGDNEVEAVLTRDAVQDLEEQLLANEAYGCPVRFKATSVTDDDIELDIHSVITHLEEESEDVWVDIGAGFQVKLLRRDLPTIAEFLKKALRS